VAGAGNGDGLERQHAGGSKPPPPLPSPHFRSHPAPKTATVLQNLHYACVLCWYIGLLHSSNAVCAGLKAPESVRSYGKARRECPESHHIGGGGDAQQHTCERCCVIRLCQSQVIRACAVTRSCLILLRLGSGGIKEEGVACCAWG